MGKVLVLYDSASGNTAKMAGLVAEGAGSVPGVEVRLRSKLTTAHYGAITAREPREEGARAACRLLGKRLAEWVAVFCDGRKDQHPLNKSDVRLPPG
jgi:hypothetical protein